MKLEKLTITNFRGLKGDQNIIDFSKSNIIFLIGQNNVGKSTYLRAYEFFVNPKQTAAIEDFFNHSESNPITIEGRFIKEPEDDNDPDFVGKGKSADPTWMEKWVDSNGYIRIRKTWKFKNNSFQKETFSPSEDKWVSNGFGGMDSIFTKYAPKPIAINAMEDESTLEEKVNKLIQDDFIKKIREDQADLCSEIVDKIKELQEKILGSEKIAQLNEDLNINFKKVFSDLELRIAANNDENIKLEDAFKKNHTISVQNNYSTRNDSFLRNGHGIIRQALFNFLTFLKENQEGARKEFLILFEEPELFLHPKIAYKLRESLYELAENSPYQILCATHSPLMIDISKPHSSLIRTVKKEDETTLTYQLDTDIYTKNEELKQRVQMINRFNPHICEVFYADKVILVEGDTETIVYRDLLKRFYPKEEIFVLNTGSKNNISFFQNILTEFRIPHCIIHDMDTKLNSIGANNSAWTLNGKIWDLVERANSVEPGLARRYVHNSNFETAHKYILSGGKDKPLRAYTFASRIQDRKKDIPDCLKWLDDYVGAKSILHDPSYVDANSKTIEEVNAEMEEYKGRE